MSRKTVAVLIRRLAGLPLRRKATRVPPVKTVTDLVKRDFRRDGPNQLWVTDIERREVLFDRVGVRDRHRRVVAAVR